MTDAANINFAHFPAKYNKLEFGEGHNEGGIAGCLELSSEVTFLSLKEIPSPSCIRRFPTPQAVNFKC